jgi:small subunit ribosomal protein S7
MPRRREVPKREILPDPKFGNVELAKFMNVVMLSGKKAVAEGIVYGALTQIQTKTGKDAMEVFKTAIENVKPMVEVKSRRVGGATYQVPVEVRSEGRGGAMKKRDEVHRMAEANKAFSHFRF